MFWALLQVLFTHFLNTFFLFLVASLPFESRSPQIQHIRVSTCYIIVTEVGQSIMIYMLVTELNKSDLGNNKWDIR